MTQREDHREDLGEAFQLEEDAPLLDETQPEDGSKKPRTPLPKVQIGILTLIQFVSPVSAQSIYPYINQLIRELGITHGDETKVGYYAGLIESLFFVTQACTTLSWSRLSDHIGRKPVILIGLSGLSISMLSFGLSRTFVTLVLSRCVCGVLNGSSGVMKGMMGELLDATNMAQGFALLPIYRCVGVTVGPFIGGLLARPADSWPHLFSGRFWHEYPYFLPCFAVSVLVVLIAVVMALFLKETLPRRKAKRSSSESPEDAQADFPSDAPPPMRALLIPSILIPIANNGLLAVVETGYNALVPLFYSTPLSNGGLGFSPAAIGILLGCFGILNGIAQILFFAPIVHRLGPTPTFKLSVAFFFPIFALFPIMSWYVARSGVGGVVWGCLVLQLLLQTVKDMAYGTVTMHITSSAPSKRSLGSVIGISQTVSSVARGLGPAMATSSFAASKQYNLLGGNFVYAAMVVLTFCVLYLGSWLPNELPKRRN